MAIQQLLNDIIDDSFGSCWININTSYGQYLKGFFQVKMENGKNIFGSFQDQLLIVYYEGLHSFRVDFSLNGPLSFKIIIDFNLIVCFSELLIKSTCFRLFDGSVDLTIGNLKKKILFKLGLNLSLETIEFLGEMWRKTENLEREISLLKKMLKTKRKQNKCHKIVKTAILQNNTKSFRKDQKNKKK